MEPTHFRIPPIGTVDDIDELLDDLDTTENNIDFKDSVQLSPSVTLYVAYGFIGLCVVFIVIFILIVVYLRSKCRNRNMASRQIDHDRVELRERNPPISPGRDDTLGRNKYQHPTPSNMSKTSPTKYRSKEKTFTGMSRENIRRTSAPRRGVHR